MSLEFVLFIILGIMAVASALALVSSRSPITAAMFMVMHFLSLAGLYLTLHAQFMAVIQVLVYAGAIMVLVVFVIMLLNLGSEQKVRERLASRETAGVGIAILIGGTLIFAVTRSLHGTRPAEAALEATGTINAVGTALFTTYVFPFELVSLVLLAAVVGAVVLTKRHLR